MSHPFPPIRKRIDFQRSRERAGVGLSPEQRRGDALLAQVSREAANLETAAEARMLEDLEYEHAYLLMRVPGRETEWALALLRGIAFGDRAVALEEQEQSDA